MLKNLLEQRTIGNRDFLPLSGQALLGFRLLPGAVRHSLVSDGLNKFDDVGMLITSCSTAWHWNMDVFVNLQLSIALFDS